MLRDPGRGVLRGRGARVLPARSLAAMATDFAPTVAANWLCDVVGPYVPLTGDVTRVSFTPPLPVTSHCAVRGMVPVDEITPVRRESPGEPAKTGLVVSDVGVNVGATVGVGVGVGAGVGVAVGVDPT